ncbi:helix-turn-helix domain-containing protein [Litorivicinus sp.]|nr:helix-turn-helix domain-containing protein [Litorivicinus sp.]
MPEETGRQSKTLVRGLSILNACSSSRSGLTLVEFADTTDLAPSTVHGFSAIFEAHTFLSIDHETGRWRIGVFGFRIGSAFSRSLNYVAQLRRLMIEQARPSTSQFTRVAKRFWCLKLRVRI